MKILLVGLLLVSMNSFAQETSTTREANVESIVKKSKSNRKKKVEMCHECGKPEVKCDCKGEEHKKDK